MAHFRLPGAWTLCLVVLASHVATAAAPATAAGAQVFAANCAVCHGEGAQGVPSTFPPLGNQVIALARLPAGRDYLVTALTGGLIGSVSVAGESYTGAMPAQTRLTAADVATVLNFLAAGGPQKLKAAGVRAFDAQEVTAIRERHPGVTGPAALALRPALPDA